jgi:hypothetical protein
LNTNFNYNSLQASKPWASTEDAAAFARGRGAPRGRGFRGRNGGRTGNDWNPRNDNSNSGGQDHFSPQKPFKQQGRGSFNPKSKFPKQPQNQHQQRGGGGNNNNAGFQQKPRFPQKNFRGGGGNN